MKPHESRASLTGDVLPIDEETRDVVTRWALDTVNGWEDEKDEVLMAAAYCLQYERALSLLEKELRTHRMTAPK